MNLILSHMSNEFVWRLRTDSTYYLKASVIVVVSRSHSRFDFDHKLFYFHGFSFLYLMCEQVQCLIFNLLWLFISSFCHGGEETKRTVWLKAVIYACVYKKDGHWHLRFHLFTNFQSMCDSWYRHFISEKTHLVLCLSHW